MAGCIVHGGVTETKNCVFKLPLYGYFITPLNCTSQKQYTCYFCGVPVGACPTRWFNAGRLIVTGG